MRRRDLLCAAGLSLSVPAVLPSVRARRNGYAPLGRVAIERAKEAVVSDDGRTAYVAATDGFAVVDLADPTAPAVVHENRNVLGDRQNGPLQGIYDVKVDGDRLLVVGPANPPGEDALQAAVVYDVSDPASPTRVTVHETDFFNHNGFIQDGLVALCGNYGNGNPLVLVDAASGEELGRWAITDVEEGWRDVPAYLYTLHDVWVQDGIAYLAYWDGGTWMVDVTDPTDPELVTRVRGRPPDTFTDLSDSERRQEYLQPPGNDHFVTVNDDATVLGIGAEAWDLDPDDDRGHPGNVELWDVSDPTAATRFSTVEAPPTSDPTPGGVWTTAHNFEITGDRLYTSWYRGGVKLHDVSDPTDPQLLAWWRDPEETSFWTAQAAVPGEFFVATSRKNPSSGTAPVGLYTFPDRAGEQTDPPALTATPTVTPTPGTHPNTTVTVETPTPGTKTPVTPTESPLPTTSRPGTPPPTTSPPETTTRAPTPPETTTGDGPGFGALATLGALGVGAWRYWRRR